MYLQLTIQMTWNKLTSYTTIYTDKLKNKAEFSFEIRIIWKDVDEVLYHSVAEFILFLENKKKASKCGFGLQNALWLHWENLISANPSEKSNIS